jgi:hypothetical protein
MTERKTTERDKTALSIFQRVDTENLPAPWVPADLEVSTDAPGRAVAKHDGSTGDLPAIWMPAELSHDAAAADIDDRQLAVLKPWVPPELPASAEASRKLP